MASPTNKSGYVTPSILVDDSDNVIPVVDDAAFTAGTNGVIPVAGVYQSTVDEVDANDAGAVRMTARRAAITSYDYLATNITTASLTSAAVTVNGVYVEDCYNGLLGSTDGATYGTVSQLWIPMAIEGWRHLWIKYHAGGTAWDTTITHVLRTNTTGNSHFTTTRGGDYMSFTQASGANNLYFGIGDGTVGQGGSTGGATASNADAYIVKFPTAAPYITWRMTGSGTPTLGALGAIYIFRTT